ncbi:MAG TPA: septum formation initiator family protein [Acidobacteriaceae bacterium]|nr:septum formation initiator family protein [Acidobacteriaceae bacterium]
MSAAGKNSEQVKDGVIQRASAALYRVRRRIATGLGIVLVLFLTYHVVFGRNGLNNYEQKRVQNRELQKQIESLEQQNQQLKDHDARLKNDPDAIEFEAREKLHYARPGEVIYTLNDQPQTGNSNTAAGSTSK